MILIGMNLEETTSEYEPEARTILPRLRMCDNSDDVVTVAYEEFQKWFGPDIAGDNSSVLASFVQLAPLRTPVGLTLLEVAATLSW